MSLKTQIQKNIEEFDERFIPNKTQLCHLSHNWKDIKDFLQSFNLQALDDEIEGMKKTEDNDEDFYIDYPRSAGFNQALSSIQDIIREAKKDLI